MARRSLPHAKRLRFLAPETWALVLQDFPIEEPWQTFMPLSHEDGIFFAFLPEISCMTPAYGLGTSFLLSCFICLRIWRVNTRFDLLMSPPPDGRHLVGSFWSSDSICIQHWNSDIKKKTCAMSPNYGGTTLFSSNLILLFKDRMYSCWNFACRVSFWGKDPPRFQWILSCHQCFTLQALVAEMLHRLDPSLDSWAHQSVARISMPQTSLQRILNPRSVTTFFLQTERAEHSLR